MRYGFAIDHRKCIGCHACTVACKTEHDVPLGQFRTWVKYTERGEFPHARRFFNVLRCNHCTNPPCVTICPTSALIKRADGIVDFNGDACIGCKACMQACPYDALYIDARTNTAAKCNFCAHRVEVGLAPACVIVCPEQAIIAGDLDDPASELRQLLNREPAEVRKPEQGTGPNVYYIGADSASLSPASIERGQTYLWSEPQDEHGASLRPQPSDTLVPVARIAPPAPRPGTPVIEPYAPPAARAARGPRADTSTSRDLVPLARVTYDVHHPIPWGWRVALYLWTKGIAAGALLVPALFAGLGLGVGGRTLGMAGGVLALMLNALTVYLLVIDLKRPERFLYILIRPNMRSWLARGAYVLVAHGGLSFMWLVGSVTHHDVLLHAIAWPAVIAGVLAACYTAFLFGQAEGRDLWQSPLLFWHLLAQAVIAGCASLMLVAVLQHADPWILGALAKLLAGALAVQALVLLGEVFGKSPTQEAALAHDLMVHGTYAAHFWVGVISAGTVMPFAILIASRASTGGAPAACALASVLVLSMLLLYEFVFIRAGQEVPLS